MDLKPLFGHTGLGSTENMLIHCETKCFLENNIVKARAMAVIFKCLNLIYLNIIFIGLRVNVNTD